MIKACTGVVAGIAVSLCSVSPTLAQSDSEQPALVGFDFNPNVVQAPRFEASLPPRFPSASYLPGGLDRSLEGTPVVLATSRIESALEWSRSTEGGSFGARDISRRFGGDDAI